MGCSESANGKHETSSNSTSGKHILGETVFRTNLCRMRPHFDDVGTNVRDAACVQPAGVFGRCSVAAWWSLFFLFFFLFLSHFRAQVVCFTVCTGGFSARFALACSMCYLFHLWPEVWNGTMHEPLTDRMGSKSTSKGIIMKTATPTAT